MRFARACNPGVCAITDMLGSRRLDRAIDGSSQLTAHFGACDFLLHLL
jgi:hypothetical protein